jgi:hypothetical protein
LALRKRIEKAEKAARPKRTALFIIKDGKADGRAWWNDKLTWSDLSKREFDQLAADLEGEGVEVLSLNFIVAHAKDQGVNGWNESVRI